MSQRRQPHGRKSKGNTLELLLEFHTLFRVSINYLGSVFPFKNTAIARALKKYIEKVLLFKFSTLSRALSKLLRRCIPF